MEFEFSGRLSAFPPSDILQWAHNDKRTGALVVRRSGHSKRIYFRDGAVVACLSDDPAEHYGQLLVLHGYLDHAGLMRALGECQRSNLRLGVVLRELGILAPEEIQRTLRQQMEDAICDIFLWRGGVFYFEEDEPPREEILPSPIDPLRLALEGARWIDDYARFRRLFIHDNIVLGRGGSWPGEGLSPLAERVRDAIDGTSTLEAIHKRINGSYFRFLEAAYDLARSGVADILEVREQSSGRSYETGVHDLLYQQAAAEILDTERQLPSLPLEVLEHLFPLWTGEVPFDGNLEESQDELWRRWNGSRALGELLSADPEARNREVDSLLLALHQRKVALLPQSIEELEDQGGDRPWWRRLLSAVRPGH